MRPLRHVLWIGGPPGSGKTTVATRLARRHGLRWYGADCRTWEHRDRAIRAGNAAALRWEAMTPHERWEKATPAEMFDMSSPLIVADGSPVSPSAVEDRSHAVWLIPTPDFQRAQLEKRGLPAGPSALYLLLATEIEQQASEHGVRVLSLDRSRGLDGMVAAVESLFADALAVGPLAVTTEERRTLLREANAAIVSHVRGYYARPWAEGDAYVVVRESVCECGDTHCEASVELAVGPSKTGRCSLPAMDERLHAANAR